MASKKRRKGGKQRKKGDKISASTISPIENIKNWYIERQSVVKFLLGFIGCMGLFYLFYHSALYRNHLEIPLLNLQANISNLLLVFLNYETNVLDTTISGGGFSVNIKSGCDGLEAMAILVSGILIFPTSFKLKIPGLIWGISILAVLNLLRIAGLYLVGFHFSKATFDILHIQGGFVIFTMISVLLWFAWMNWSLKKIQETQTS